MSSHLAVELLQPNHQTDGGPKPGGQGESRADTGIGMESWKVLFDILVLLSASLLLGGLMARWGQSPLLGYLLAGMVLGGPGSLDLVGSAEEIEFIAELGVALLLYSLGLEFSFQRMQALGSRLLWGGVLQVVVTLLVGGLIALLGGMAMREATAVGAMVSLSSTACVLRVLMDRAETDTPHGRITIGVLLVQDIAVVPLASLMTILQGTGTPLEIATNVARILLFAGGLVVVLYLVLSKIAVATLGTLTLERNRELTLLTAVSAGLGSAWAAHAVGVSPALGAFVAGMFLGSSRFATQIRADVSSLRMLLLTLFFGAAGMVADPAWIAQHWYLVLGCTLLLIAVKTLIVWAVYTYLGQPSQVGLAAGLCLAQIGEFAFVLGSMARGTGVISADTHSLIVSVTIASLFATPLLVARAASWGIALARLCGADRFSPTAAPSNHDSPEVVVIGFGVAGELAAAPLVGSGRQVLVLELNQAGAAKAHQHGFHAEIGDARQADVLEDARLSSARLVLITIPHYATANQVLALARHMAPSAEIIVRSRYQIHSHLLQNAGATAVFGDEEEIGDRLQRYVREWLSQ